MEVIVIIKNQFGVVVKNVGYKLGDWEFSPTLDCLEPTILSQP